MIINSGLIRNWENWVTIILMVLIGSFAVNELAKLVIKKDYENGAN